MNNRGGFESALTVIRLAQERFLIITGSAQATRDMDWTSRNIDSNKVAILTDVSAQFCVLSLMEPHALALLARVSPDENPFEAGLAYTVNLDKAVPFIGKGALLKAKSQPLRKKLIIVVLDSSAAYAWGGEGIVVDGETVGELTSAGWSPKANACVGLGYVRGAEAQLTHAGAPVQIELWGKLVAATAWDQ